MTQQTISGQLQSWIKVTQHFLRFTGYPQRVVKVFVDSPSVSEIENALLSCGHLNRCLTETITAVTRFMF